MSDLAVMQGFPVPAESRVPREDWDRAPWNRWSFQHVREILPTVEVWRGDGPVWTLPENLQPLDDLTFTPVGGGEQPLSDWLASSFTDGFIVLHDGAVVFERYFDGMGERTLHLSQSVAKSVTSAVAGILVGRGLLDPDAPVTEYLPELAATGWRDARLRHVLDMTSGVRFVEDYTALDSDIADTDIASGWKPARPDRAGFACIWDQIVSLTEQFRDHGEVFEYRSIETDVLAHCMERVTGLRLADLTGREFWARIGAAESACFTVDGAGYALADGGFNACLRDYARFGQMLCDDGIADGRRVVPAEWIADIRRNDPTLFGSPYTDVLPHGAYRNQFWIEDHRRDVIMARGVFGQLVYVSPQDRLVAVKLSSWPEFQSVQRSRDTLNAIHAIARHLNSPT